MNENKTNGEPQLEINASVATITFRRLAEHNRIDPADLPVFSAHLDAVQDRSGLNALVITGLGHQTFSSGYTLSAIRSELNDDFEELLDQLEAFPLPVICALNGSVYGGATDLALCCDFRIGVRGSRMMMPAVKFGLHYYPAGIRRYIANLGLTASKQLFLTGAPVYAEEMLRIGFLTELVEPSLLTATIDRYLAHLDDIAVDVAVTMKAHLNATARGEHDAAAQRAAYKASLTSDELRRRVAGFG